MPFSRASDPEAAKWRNEALASEGGSVSAELPRITAHPPATEEIASVTFLDLVPPGVTRPASLLLLRPPPHVSAPSPVVQSWRSVPPGHSLSEFCYPLEYLAEKTTRPRYCRSTWLMSGLLKWNRHDHSDAGELASPTPTTPRPQTPAEDTAVTGKRP